MYQIVSSYGNHAISMTLQDSVITFLHLPAERPFTDYFFVILDDMGREEFQSITFHTPQKYFSIPQTLKDGIHFFSIAIKSPYNRNSYCYYLGIKDVPFEKRGDYITFSYSAVHNDNFLFLRLLSEEFAKQKSLYRECIAPSKMIQSNNIEIKDLAHALTNKIPNTVSKIKSIYFWVSRHLYYDKDALENGSYRHHGQSALEALNNVRCVCQGFANLTVALCRSIGIPSICIGVYVLPTDCFANWNEEKHNKANSNHQIPLAWNGTRWIIMDPTFDNDHYYNSSDYQERSGTGIPYKYFDNTIAFISQTHHFVSLIHS